MKRFVSRCMVAISTIIVCSLSGLAQADAAHPVVALLPGVVDPFYFTMHRGAERAAKEENVELLFQVPKEWNTSEQVPILKAFIAKHPDVLLISPVDKVEVEVIGEVWCVEDFVWNSADCALLFAHALQ